MAALLKLQQNCAKAYKSFDDLPVGEYIVTKFEKAEKSKFGKRIKIDVNDEKTKESFYMFLPERCSTMTPEEITQLNSSPIKMFFDGKDADRGGRVLIHFASIN